MLDFNNSKSRIEIIDQEDRALGAADKAAIQRVEVLSCQLPDSGT
jgi:hypothetical protein